MTTELVALQTNMGASFGLLWVICGENVGDDAEYNFLLEAAIEGRVPLIRATESQLDFSVKFFRNHSHIF